MARAFNTMTLFDFVASRFAGATMGGVSFTSGETAILVGGTALMNYIFVGTTYETGVVVGSVASVAIQNSFRRYHGCR